MFSRHGFPKAPQGYLNILYIYILASVSFYSCSHERGISSLPLEIQSV
jgi:hypothetical protein